MTANSPLKPAANRISTGFERLDDAIQGGFLPGSAVVLTASSTSDVSMLLRGFLEEASRHKGNSLLVSRSLASARTIAPSETEHLTILVCGETVTASKGVIGGKSLDNLTELSIQMSEAVASAKPERMVIGILSDALLRHKALLTRKWLSDLLSKLRSRGITILALINPSMHPREEVEALLDLFDGNLEVVERTLRVKWMHQIEVAHEEVSLSSLAKLMPTPNSVAVVDFSNLANATEIDWLSAGIAETVTVDLKKISSLKVVSREKVSKILQPYSGGKVTEEQIIDLGTSLGVRWIVWGGYQKIGNSIRVTAHFTEVSTGELVGSTKLDGTMEDLFKLQDQIIITLTETLNLETSEAELRKVHAPETSNLQAYEYYIKGRQAFSQFGRKSFDEAQELYEKAIEIDSKYALAYAGLGSIHIFRFIEQTDLRDLDIGISYLQKGLQYDPDLADCHIWLTYAHTRKQQFDEAIEAGLRAVVLDRDNFMAHYFLGAAYTIKASMRCAPSLYAEAVRHLKRSTELQTNYQPPLMILGWIFMLYGQYEDAKKSLDRAVAIEELEKFEGVRFVGALTLMGDLQLRQNRFDAATDLYRRSLDLLERREHFYKQPFIALSHCNLGYAYLGRGKYHDALDNFKHSCAVIEKYPKGLGIGYFLVRAHLGMANAFHHLGMTREAQQHFDKSLELFRQKSEFDFSWIFEGTDAQAHYDFASNFALTEQSELALEQLRKAIACGWRDVPHLEADNNLDDIRSTAEYQQILQDLQPRIPLS